ncbi:hypothetical protein GCM10010232_65300 [Streptomyces amakusaensis]
MTRPGLDNGVSLDVVMGDYDPDRDRDVPRTALANGVPVDRPTAPRHGADLGRITALWQRSAARQVASLGRWSCLVPTALSAGETSPHPDRGTRANHMVQRCPTARRGAHAGTAAHRGRTGQAR